MKESESETSEESDDTESEIDLNTDDTDDTDDTEHESSDDESDKKKSQGKDQAKSQGTDGSGKLQWDGTAGRNGSKRLNKNNGKEKGDKDKKKKLSGISQEQSVCLYVQNIKRNDNSTLGEIASLVRSHLKGNGIRCLSAQVIRNRFVEDTVGCKIMVPLRQKDEVIGIKIWPDKIRCREWAGNWDETGASIARIYGENDEKSSSSGLQGNDRPRDNRVFRRRYNNHFNLTPAPWYPY